MLMLAVFILTWLSREGESVRSVGNDGGSGGSCAASGDGVSWEFVVVVGLLGCWVCCLICSQMLGSSFVCVCL